MSALLLLLIPVALIIAFWLFLYQEKKEGKIFFAELKKDLIFSLLLNEAAKESFIVEPVSKIFGGHGMNILLNSRKIWITGGLIKDYLKKKVTAETIRFIFAHELGHIENFDIQDQILKICPSFKKLSDPCLFEELLASKKALEILKKIGENNLEDYQHSWLFWLSPAHIQQCQKCFRKVTKEKMGNCPKQKEVEMIGRIIEEKLGIK